MKQYDNFFIQFGGVMHFSIYYQQYTFGGTRNLNHEQAQLIQAKASNAASYLNDSFRYMHADFNAGKLKEAEFKKYLKFYKIIVDDTSVLAGNIRQNKSLLDAVKQYC